MYQKAMRTLLILSYIIRRVLDYSRWLKKENQDQSIFTTLIKLTLPSSSAYLQNLTKLSSAGTPLCIHRPCFPISIHSVTSQPTWLMQHHWHSASPKECLDSPIEHGDSETVHLPSLLNFSLSKSTPGSFDRAGRDLISWGEERPFQNL